MMPRAIIEDLRYGVRLLRKTPIFTFVAVITLALGIGANTAIFTLLDRALLRSLPVKDPNQLVLLQYNGVNGGYSHTRSDGSLYFSYPMYRDLRDHNSVFSGIIATAEAHVGIQWHDDSRLAEAEMVSDNYFDVLGVQPALGRLFVPSEDIAQNADPFVVLSFSYWQQRFGSDPLILNQIVSINGHSFTVIGVAAPRFYSVVSGDHPDVFVPMMMKPQITPGWNDLDERRSVWLNIVGRLRPGLSREQAEAGIDPLWHSIRAEELKQMGNSSERFKEAFLTKSHLSLIDGSKGAWAANQNAATTVLIIMAMAALMGLMASANVGGLLLVRAGARVREISVRYALGAKRSRVMRQLLSEGLLLGVAGGIAGMILAPQITGLLTRFLWSKTAGQLALASRLDLRILAFNFVLTLFVSLLFSLAPALQFWRPDVGPALKQQIVTVLPGHLRLRRGLVVAQISLSLLLLIGAGLFVRTLQNLRSLNLGFTTEHVVTFAVDPRMAGYEPAETPRVYERILEELAKLPGVRSVAATTDPELANNNTGSNITVEGYHEAENEDMNVETGKISPGYFSTLQMPLLTGRDFSLADRIGKQKVAVVNDSFARRYFGTPGNALGRAFGWGQGDVELDTQIVGVVSDIRHTGVREKVRRTVYTPFLQEKEGGTNAGGMTFYVRTWQQPESAESAIRKCVHDLESKLVLSNLYTMQQQIDQNLNNERAIAFLASSFGALAALMAGIGIYGVLAYSTAQRTREIGVRMAVGASRAAVIQLVLKDVLWMVGIGIAVGIPVSLVLVRLLRSQLYGVSNGDPLTLCVVCLTITAVAIVSSAVPARRAAKVDPIVALRYE